MLDRKEFAYQPEISETQVTDWFENCLTKDNQQQLITNQQDKDKEEK